jgi:hypothetical protein
MTSRTSTRCGRKVRTQIHAVNSNSRTSNCHCSLFAKKNPVIQIFFISRWLTIPVIPDKWSGTVPKVDSNDILVWFVLVPSCMGSVDFLVSAQWDKGEDFLGGGGALWVALCYSHCRVILRIVGIGYILCNKNEPFKILQVSKQKCYKHSAAAAITYPKICLCVAVRCLHCIVIIYAMCDFASKNKYQDIPGGKDGWCVRVTTLPASCAECLEILEP